MNCDNCGATTGTSLDSASGIRLCTGGCASLAPTWEIETAEADSDRLKRMLADGWEPFAAVAMDEERHNSRGYVEQSWQQVVYHLRRVTT